MTVPALLARIELGTFPDWLAAIGTAGALAFALVLFARDQEDRHRAQARLISAWPTAPQPSQGSVMFALMVKNNSTEPVYRVTTTMVPYDSPHADDPESAAGQVGTVRSNLPILPPGEVSKEDIDMIQTGIAPGAVGVSFTDAQGIRWRRLPDGTLRGHRQVRPGAPPRVGPGALWYGR